MAKCLVQEGGNHLFKETNCNKATETHGGHKLHLTCIACGELRVICYDGSLLVWSADTKLFNTVHPDLLTRDSIREPQD